MEHILATPLLHIKNQFVPRAGNALCLCDLPGCHEKIGNHRTVLFSEVIDTANVFSGNQEDVDRGVGICILKGHNRIPLEYKAGGSFPPNNLAKNAVLFHTFLGAPVVRFPARIDTYHINCRGESRVPLCAQQVGLPATYPLS